MHQKCYKCLYITSAHALQKIVKELTLSNLNLYPNQARLVNPLSFNFFSSAFYISLNSLAIFTFFVTLVFFYTCLLHSVCWSLFFARFSLLSVCCSLHFPPCLLVFPPYSFFSLLLVLFPHSFLLSSRQSLVFARCSLFLLVTFCLLLVTFCLLQFMSCSYFTNKQEK